MSKQTIRPYEMSLWTLQDSFITVLKSLNVSQKGHIQEPVITIKTDGTQELNFSIPMYIFNGKELVENPIWYNVINGTLIANLRKIKIIFNKGNKELEKIYEFVIEKVTETHQNGMLMCEVMGTGLAFQELGKSGYKIYFGLDEFEEEYANWFEQENPNKDEEPVANIDYWAKKLVEGTNWDYEVQMDWSAYDGITNDSLRTSEDRQPNKVYEDEYIASWDATTGSLTPTRYESYREKARIVSAEKSNRYNISQTIAETFGIFCRYQYEYDDNYHIIGRKIIFYNTFLDEKSGKMDIEYPYHTNSIKRELDSVDVTTRLFVTPIADSSTASGLITIADVEANRTYDDFILNFDYLYSIGTISQEQYDNISEYETALYILNHKLSPIQNRINEIDLTLADAKGKLIIAEDAVNLAREEVASANAMIRAQVGEDGVLERTDGNPAQAVLLSSSDGYYIKVAQEGVYGDTLHLYESYENGKVANEIKSFKIVRDEFGNISRLTGLYYNEELKNSKFRYLTYQYRPNSHYEKIRDHYNLVISSKEAEAQELNKLVNDLEDELVSLQEELNTLLEEKNKLNGNFERLMGPALREGSWQADEYTNYGQKGRETISAIGNKGNDLVTSIWDTETLDDSEQKSYYESSTNQNIEYYVVIDIENYVNTLIAAGLKNIFLNQRDSSGKIIYQAGINSDLYYAFYKSGSHIKPGIIIADEKFNLANGKISLDQVGLTDDNGAFLQTIKTIISYENISYIDIINNYTQVYPRIIINSDLAQTTSDSLIIKNAASQTLEKYYDYSVLLKELIPYITLKSETVLTNTSSQVSNGLLGSYTISYTLTNASLALYLDALEVSRENAYPKASYEVELNVFNEELLKAAYNLLGKISHINDHELHFENVQGYISELTLSLDKPWEDKFVIQNYKTKFEDLFSRIVASSEQMKTNALVYDRAASAFDSNGALKKENIQLTLNQSDLNYSFANGTLTINERDGIWGVSDSGVVAFRGGGIFTANKVDAVGNWIWNSGITPNGINAALLTAGQIDTNLIKIYAGDNVKFQLNADGLFAYRSNADGTSIANNYVVHNSEGLFLAAPINRVDEEGKETSGTYNQVEVSWDGFIIRNSKEEEVFYADDEGNLTLAGYIYASGGEVGGWGLDKTSLFSLGNTIDENGNIVKGIEGGVGMASAARVNEDLTIDEYTINDDGTYIVFWAGRNHDKINTDTNLYDDKFQVLSDGTLKASGVVIEGTINATGGKIGNLTIQEVEDGAKGISSVQLVPITGRNFYQSTTVDGNSSTFNPGSLTFQIKYNGALGEKTPSDIELSYSGDGLDFTTINGKVMVNSTNFTISPSDIGNGGEASLTLRLVVKYKDENNIETTYQAFEQIGFVYNGKDGLDADETTNIRIEFVQYDNYYKWYNTLVPDENQGSVGTYIYSPTVMKVAISSTNGKELSYKGKDEYVLKYNYSTGISVENNYSIIWNNKPIEAEPESAFVYDENEKIYSLTLGSIEGWDGNLIKFSVYEPNGSTIVLQETKVISFGTSEEAAKFDFIASGAYITTQGLSYQFNDQGFVIQSVDGATGEGSNLFYADEEGNLYLDGTINANKGKIGNWNIDNEKLYKINGETYAGITTTNQSLYYDSGATDGDSNITSFLTALGIVPAGIPAGEEVASIYTVGQAQENTSGTQPSFYSGQLEPNRIGIHYDNSKGWFTFANQGTTYSFSVLMNGFVYAKNMALDGSLFLSDKISFLDPTDNILDKHVFLIKPNDSFKITNPVTNQEENIFLGINKIPATENVSEHYKLSITNMGTLSVNSGTVDNAVLIDENGIIVKTINTEKEIIENTDGTTIERNVVKQYLGNGFNINASLNNSEQEPFLWAGAGVESLANITETNTAFYVDGLGDTHIRKGIIQNLSASDFITNSLTLTSQKEQLKNLLTIGNGENYINSSGEVHFNNFYSESVIVGNDANYIKLAHNTAAVISGWDGGNNTFEIKNNGEGIFNSIIANDIQTAVFNTEEVGVLNGSLLITQYLEYIDYTRNDTFYEFTLKDSEQTFPIEGQIFSIEFNNTIYYFASKGTTSAVVLGSAPSFDNDLPSEGRLYIIGDFSVIATSIDNTENGTIFVIKEPQKVEETENNIKNADIFKDYYDNFTESYYVDNLSAVINKNEDSEGNIIWSIDKILEKNINFIIRRGTIDENQNSRIYIRALKEVPEILMYRSMNINDNPYSREYEIASHLNASSLVLKIGDLNILDEDFGEITGSGLYGQNVYLKGSLILPSAGITNNSDVAFSYTAWSGESVDDDLYDTSPIRFWAGEAGSARQKASLIITEDGSLFASQGVFKGRVVAEDGEFSGHILASGVLLEDNTSSFYFAKKNVTSEYGVKDYVIDVTANNGLEIFDNAFSVFSGQARIQNNKSSGDLYLDWTIDDMDSSYQYQFPYITASEDRKALIAYEIDTLAFSGNVTNEDKSYSYQKLRQTPSSLEWFSSISNITPDMSTLTNYWRDNIYSRAISGIGSDNEPIEQLNYALLVDKEGLKLGNSLENIAFNFTKDDELKFVIGNCLIKQVNKGEIKGIDIKFIGT